MKAHAISLILVLLATGVVRGQDGITRFETFDRYDPTQTAYEVRGVDGENIDLRTLALSWEVNDLILPGNGGLDIVISRSFNRLSHTPSDMGHWYFGVPRIQIPTSPWRSPYDPASVSIGTFAAAWSNLAVRIGNDYSGICANAGNLIDQSVTASLSGQSKAGILFAAPLQLYIPGEGSKILLEKADAATQFPDDARYVTTDNWYARCLPVNSIRTWGGFEVVSPRGVHYTFDFIQYMVPGEYGLATSGGWIEMGISRIVDAHGNQISYRYDTKPGGTDLLQSIEASDGRLITFDYYPGSVLGVDVQGSPLSLISSINVHADGEVHSIKYSYCDFADYYILKIGCTPIKLGPDKDLPVLQRVDFPDGESISYRYNPSLYTANVQLDWGNFEFLLESVRLPAGGVINYEYQPGYSPILQRTNSPAPRLALRRTSGRSMATGEWRYKYDFANHIEISTVTGPARRDIYEFYEGLGTYEFRIARYPGQHSWPDTAPTDYDEIMGQLKSHTIKRLTDDAPVRVTDYEYALLPFIGKQFYSGNWLGWPTLVLAQIRPVPLSRADVFDMDTANIAHQYATYTKPTEFDEFALPTVIHRSGVDVLSASQSREQRLDLDWQHDTTGWFIGLPAGQTIGNYRIHRDYVPGRGLVKSLLDGGVQTDFEYDPAGNRTAELRMRDGDVYRHEYRDFHRGRARFESFLVDPVSGRTQTLSRGVNDLGHLLWREDGAGNRTAFVTDFSGRYTQIAAPASAPVSVSYARDDSGNQHEVVITQQNRQRIVSLDGFGRAVLLRDYADVAQSEPPRALSWSFDAVGRKVFEAYPYLWESSAATEGVAYVYDELDRKLSETTTVNGQSKSWCYSWRCNTGEYAQAVGELLNGYVTTDENGFQTGYEFAAVGHPDTGMLTRIVEQVSRAAGSKGAEFRQTTMQRDAHGNITVLGQGDWSGDLMERVFAYQHPRLLSEYHPETGSTVYEYDELGNRTAATIENGERILYRYDGLNRLTEIDYPGQKSDTFYSYDSAGRLRFLENGISRWTYTYDGSNRLLQESLNVAQKNFDIDYEYDLLGNLAAITYPSGKYLPFEPDGLGRSTRAGSIVSAAKHWPDDSIKDMQYGNGVHAEFSRNARRLPRARTFGTQQQSLLAGFRYTYDGVGNVLKITDLLDPAYNASMKYDGLSRLTSASNILGQGRVQYDSVGNIRANSLAGRDLEYAYDARNRLYSVTASQYYRINIEHDDRGNIISADSYNYDYNDASQLETIEQLPDLSYLYDGNGRRIVTNQTDGASYSVYNRAGMLTHIDSCESGGEVSDFIYLGGELVGRMDSECSQGCHP